MRKAVIDIGTNSTRLLLAVIEKNQITEMEKYVEITRIGQRVQEGKKLTKDGMERTIKVLKSFYEKAKGYKAEEIIFFATSAVRDATNRQEFLEKVYEEMNVDIAILSGEEEAQVGFIGALLGMDVEEEIVMVLDIGGGSTEIVVGNSREILDKKSIDMGAVRFTELYGENLVSMGKKVRQFLEEQGGCFLKYSLSKVIGVAGTITTIAAMEQKMEQYDRNKIQDYILEREKIRENLDRLMEMDLEERKKIKGLQPKRADIIHAGIVILLEIMDYYQLDKIMVRDSDNLEGTLLKK